MKLSELKKDGLNKVFLRKMWDGTKVYMISGKFVRDTYDNDYLLGGHGYVYKYIPKDEIWIEDVILNDHEPEILAHELFEWYMMKYHKKRYPEAHKIASDFEKALREISKIRSDKNASERN